MDYEKKYKEARARARVIHLSKKEVEYIFPELKESEDVKMRKAIHLYLGGLNGRTSIAPKGDYSINDMLTWLEKQDTPRYNIGDIICDKSCTTLNKDAQPNMEIVDIQNGMYICDKGSFPVSQQDEYELVSKRIDTKLNDGSVSNELREASFAHARKEMMSTTCPNNMTFEFAYNFEEGAKWQAAQKPSWSKDDGVLLEEIVKDLQVCKSRDISRAAKDVYQNEIDWLKSLKDRSTWKPSEAQMIVLNEIITDGHLPNANERILKGLRDQLEKLK